MLAPISSKPIDSKCRTEIMICPKLAHNPADGESQDAALSSAYRGGSRLVTSAAAVSSAGGLLGFRRDGFDLIHDLHGIFARHAIGLEDGLDVGIDRKSTRLNSSHL